MSITEHKHGSKDDVVPARRIEVFTGAGRRRAWSAEDKASIVAESLVSAVSISAVARQHGLTPAQLFAWRREARALSADTNAPAFVPAIVEQRADAAWPHEIELDIGGDTVWIWRGADAGMVTTVIRALKASK